jgi:hypothetical protein
LSNSPFYTSKDRSIVSDGIHKKCKSKPKFIKANGSLPIPKEISTVSREMYRLSKCVTVIDRSVSKCTGQKKFRTTSREQEQGKPSRLQVPK